MKDDYLAAFSLDELKEEVRQRELTFDRPSIEPWASGHPSLSNLIEVCETFMDETQKYGRAEDNPVFEAAIELVYGEDAWDWINSIEKEQ